jgi:hypothetical protein
MFRPITELPSLQGAVIRSIERLAHHYAWMTYAEIRSGVSRSLASHSASGKTAILSTLGVLETLGYIQMSNGKYGFTPQYDSWRRAVKATEGGAR